MGQRSKTTSSRSSSQFRLVDQSFLLLIHKLQVSQTIVYFLIDFAQISRRLGEMWALVPNQEKYNWRKRAKRLALNPSILSKDNKMPPPSRKFINKMGKLN